MGFEVLESSGDEGQGRVGQGKRKLEKAGKLSQRSQMTVKGGKGNFLGGKVSFVSEEVVRLEQRGRSFDPVKKFINVRAVVANGF